MSKDNLPNPALEYSSALSLDLDEAVLALHALRFFISVKGAGEISEKTTLLENKLDSFLDRRLGYDKLEIEITEE